MMTFGDMLTAAVSATFGFAMVVQGWTDAMTPHPPETSDYFEPHSVSAVREGDTAILTVDRTQLLDAAYDEIINRRRVLPIDSGSVDDFWSQMKAPVRKLDDKGRRFIWSEGSAADHYRLADAYARVAADQAQQGGGFVGG